MRIAVDAMGGDHAPAEIVRGAAAAAVEYGIDISLVGLPAAVQPLLDEAQATYGRELLGLAGARAA